MLLPSIVFVGVFLIIWGAYYVAVMRDENLMLARLQPKRQRRDRRPEVLKPEESMSSVGSVNEMLVRLRVAGPVQHFLYQSGVKMTVSVYVLLIGCASVLGFWLTLLFAKITALAAIAGVLTGSIPYLWVRWKRAKRLRKFEDQFPEAIDLVARALRAGHALPTGLGMVADEIAAPVGTEFRILFDEQNFGLTLPDALRNFAKRIPVLDARFFVTAVLTQREAGGNLAEVLDNLGSVIRERFKVRRQVAVLSAHGRITGWVLGALPPALAVATFVLNPNHLGGLMHDALGQRMIVAAVVLQVLGVLWIRKLVDIEY
ncbi:MAG TPA: type II secretion system F family protein [Vicinamibacterales bacterium]|nr:type II secretion system F family protein [Vicinamibacterales bacterium]